MICAYIPRYDCSCMLAELFNGKQTNQIRLLCITKCMHEMYLTYEHFLCMYLPTNIRCIDIYMYVQIYLPSAASDSQWLF